jgi:hypothetical protein
MKKCIKCDVAKEFNDLVRDKRRKDGYTNICKICDSIKKKKYR